MHALFDGVNDVASHTDTHIPHDMTLVSFTFSLFPLMMMVDGQQQWPQAQIAVGV